MKYDPNYHYCVIRNFKAAFKAKYGRETELEDETIWNLYQKWGGVGTTCEEGDEAVIEAMEEMEAEIKRLTLRTRV